jgi:hypothetical protein
MRTAPRILLAVAFTGCSHPGGKDMGASGADRGAVADLGARAERDLAGTQPGNTGETCTKDADCGGMTPVCITTDAQGVVWPDGYCSSTCNPENNDPGDSANNDCPGGNGTCRGSGTAGRCETRCSSKSGENPCTRVGYSCFHSCEPTALSQCDPTRKGTCPQDGGAPITVVDYPDGGIPDGGGGDGSVGTMMTTAARVCVLVGQDSVGACSDGCDPLSAQAPGMPPPPCKPDQGCYPSYSTGEGFCFRVYGGGGGDGAPCMYLNACDPGLACRTINATGNCRRLCGGPGGVACPMGQTCKDLSGAVPKSAIGSCEK